MIKISCCVALLIWSVIIFSGPTMAQYGGYPYGSNKGSGGSSYSMITQSGSNIGINTVSPAHTLEVVGNASIDLTLYGGGASFTGDVIMQNVRSLSIGTTSGTARLEIGAGVQNHIEGSSDAHFGRDIEVDGGIYVDGTLYAGSTPAVTGASCTAWTNGLCTHL